MFLALFYYGVKINVQQMVPWYDPLKKSDLIDGKITNEDELMAVVYNFVVDSNNW